MKRKRFDPVAKALLLDRNQFSTKTFVDKKKEQKKGREKHKTTYSLPFFLLIMALVFLLFYYFH